MKAFSRAFVRLTFVLVASAQLAATPVQKEIADLYRRGLAGDKNAVNECIEKLEAVLKAEPANQLARVYLGSSYTLRSRDLGFGPKKLQNLRSGLATMDAAVAAAPDQPKVRLVRALTSAALPAIFGRRASSREDFALLAAAAERTPDKFEPGDLQIIFYQAALAAKAAGDPARALVLARLALRYPADPKLAEKVQRELIDAR